MTRRESVLISHQCSLPHSHPPRSMAGIRASVKCLPHPLNCNILNGNFQIKEETLLSYSGHHSRLSSGNAEDLVILQSSLSPSQALVAIAAMVDFLSFSTVCNQQSMLV